MSKRSKTTLTTTQSALVSDILEHVKLHQAVQFNSGGWLISKDQAILQGLLQYVSNLDAGQLQPVLKRLKENGQYIDRFQTSHWQYLPAIFFMNVCSYFDVFTLLFVLSNVCKSWAAMIRTEPWQTCFVTGPRFSQNLYHRMDYLSLWRKTRLRNIRELKIEHVHMRPGTREEFQYGNKRKFIGFDMQTLAKSYPRLSRLSASLCPIPEDGQCYPQIQRLDHYRVLPLGEFMILAEAFPSLSFGKFRLDIVEEEYMRAFQLMHPKWFPDVEKEGKKEHTNPYLIYFAPWKSIPEIQLSLTINLGYSNLMNVKKKHARMLCYILSGLAATFGASLTKLQLIAKFNVPRNFQPDEQFWKLLADPRLSGITELSLVNMSFPYKQLQKLHLQFDLKRLILQDVIWTDRITLKEEETKEEKSGSVDKYKRSPFLELRQLNHLICINVSERLQIDSKSRRKVESIDPVHYLQEWARFLPSTARLDISSTREYKPTYEIRLAKCRLANIQANWSYTQGVPVTLPLTYDWHHISRIACYSGYSSDGIEYQLMKDLT